MHAKQRLVLSLALLVVSASQTAFATDSDTWQFEVTPYVFAAGMNGTVGVRGVTSQANKSFGDILGSLDQGFMGLAMASRGPWTYSLEAVYMKLGDDSVKSVTGPFGQVTVKGALSVTS